MRTRSARYKRKRLWTEVVIGTIDLNNLRAIWPIDRNHHIDAALIYNDECVLICGKSERVRMRLVITKRTFNRSIELKRADRRLAWCSADGW